MPAFRGETSAEPRNLDASFPMFRPDEGLGLDGDDDLRNGLTNASASEANSAHDGSPPGGGEYDNMFMDMTNHDADGGNDTVPSLEQETSHASEALDMIRTASHGPGSDHAELGDGDIVSKHFDDFINGDEPS